MEPNGFTIFEDLYTENHATEVPTLQTHLTISSAGQGGNANYVQSQDLPQNLARRASPVSGWEQMNGRMLVHSAENAVDNIEERVDSFSGQPFDVGLSFPQSNNQY